MGHRLNPSNQETAVIRTIYLMVLAMLWMVTMNLVDAIERMLSRTTKPVVILFHAGKRNLFMVFVRIRYRGIRRKKYLIARRLWRQYRKNKYLSPEDVLILCNLETDGYIVGWWPRPVFVAESKGAAIQRIHWVKSKLPR